MAIPNYTEIVEYSYQLFEVSPSFDCSDTVVRSKGTFTMRRVLAEWYDPALIEALKSAQFPSNEGWILEPVILNKSHDALDFVDSELVGINRTA